MSNDSLIGSAQTGMAPLFSADPHTWVSMFAAASLGAAGAFVISRYAHRLGLLDTPCERSSHVKVTPKGGGVGIVMGMLLAAVMLGASWWFYVPAVMVSIVSFFGDRIHLPQIPRLAIHFLCGGVTVAGIFLSAEKHLAMPWWLWVPLAAALTVYVVGTANFYNFMDGINGIAGFTGAVAFAALGVFGLVANATEPLYLSGLCLCVSAACLGFLPFNCPKARVFMGDVGSILLGFLFAVATILLSNSIVDFLCLNSFLFPFYADELSTMVVRLRSGENLLRAHRRHVYQILANQRGIPHWKVTALYVAMQLLVGSVSFAAYRISFGLLLIWLAVVCFAFVSAAAYVRQWEETPPGGRRSRVAVAGHAEVQ